MNGSYSTELQKALNIYRCLNKNTYGISISGGDNVLEENKESVKRKTGAENILLYGVPGAGKSHEIKTKYCDDEKYMERVVFIRIIHIQILWDKYYREWKRIEMVTIS